MVVLLMMMTRMIRYCASYYKEGVQGIFVQLLENYLSSRFSQSEKQTRIASLLNKYPYSVDPLQCMELLQAASFMDCMNMRDLAVYFSYQLSQRLQRVREAELVRDLHGAKVSFVEAKGIAAAVNKDHGRAADRTMRVHVDVGALSPKSDHARSGKGTGP